MTTGQQTTSMFCFVFLKTESTGGTEEELRNPGCLRKQGLTHATEFILTQSLAQTPSQD